MKNILFIYAFLITNFFILFRYIRANQNIFYFSVCLLSLGLAIYITENISILLTSLLIIIGLLEIFIAFFKERKHPAIIKMQSGYKPLETIYHFIIFMIIYWLGAIVILKIASF